MRYIACQQGTPEWDAARCGLITASCFSDAVSTVGGLTDQQQRFVNAVLKGVAEKDAAAFAGYKAVPRSDIINRALRGEPTEQPSDTACRYAADLAIELVSGKPFGQPVKTWLLNRGHEMEALARMHYEARTKAFVTEAGICVTNDNHFGYSTDGLVDEDGLIEIKAPIDGAKILHILRSGDLTEYMRQMQGGMWITGRKWCDFIMYVPDLAAVGKDLYVKRVLRDDGFIDTMVGQLHRFHHLVEANVAILREQPESQLEAA